MKILLKILISILFCTEIYAQEKVKYKAEELKFRRINKEPVRKLISNVIFTQGETQISCDSANFYNRKNLLEAFGNIEIINSDSSVITAKSLVYDGNNKTAKLRGNVIYKKNDDIIKTDILNYLVDSKKGEFFDGGQLEDGVNTLKSKFGYFFGNDDISIFHVNVEFIGDDYLLKTDSMKYNSKIKEATTYSFTEIFSDDSVYVEASGGKFKQSKSESSLKSSTIESDDYILKAKFIDFDNDESLYEAFDDVSLFIKDTEYTVSGETGIYDKKNNFIKIYDNALLKKNIENDTFYLSSDTILAIENNKEIKTLLAYNSVKFYRDDFLGKSDSILFNVDDSLLFMYNDPIIWNGNNQITSDTINFILNEDKIDNMNLIRNAFIISRDTAENFNQIKGRNMIADFDENNQIKSIDVKGNGETIYFALEEETYNTIGLNYIICSDLLLNFIDNDIDNIIFYQDPKAKLIPPHEIKEKDLYIEKFNWRENERPQISDIVHYFRKKIYLRNEFQNNN